MLHFSDIAGELPSTPRHGWIFCTSSRPKKLINKTYSPDSCILNTTLPLTALPTTVAPRRATQARSCVAASAPEGSPHRDAAQGPRAGSPFRWHSPGFPWPASGTPSPPTPSRRRRSGKALHENCRNLPSAPHLRLTGPPQDLLHLLQLLHF